MSWAAHNPEKYDEIVMKGVIRWMDSLLSKHGFDVPGEYLAGLECFAECVRETPETSSIWQDLLHLAAHNILHEEAEYFGGTIDRMKDAHDHR